MFNPLILVTFVSIIAIPYRFYTGFYKKEIVLRNKADRRKDIILKGKPAIYFASLYILGSLSLLLASTIFSPVFMTGLDYLFLPSCVGGLIIWLTGLVYAYFNKNSQCLIDD